MLVRDKDRTDGCRIDALRCKTVHYRFGGSAGIDKDGIILTAHCSAVAGRA